MSTRDIISDIENAAHNVRMAADSITRRANDAVFDVQTYGRTIGDTGVRHQDVAHLEMLQVQLDTLITCAKMMGIPSEQIGAAIGLQP